MGYNPGYAENCLRQLMRGDLTEQAISEQLIREHLVTAGLPEPDLFIRSGGEERISNFLLWQLAYTEFYFTEICGLILTKISWKKPSIVSKVGKGGFGHTGEQMIDNTSSLATFYHNQNIKKAIIC